MRPWRTVADGVLLSVRLQPGAGRNAIDGIEALADGSPVLKARVTAPPEDGKANAALIKLLAKTWRLAKRDIAVVAGQTARNKTLKLSGDPAALTETLESWAKD